MAESVAGGAKKAPANAGGAGKMDGAEKKESTGQAGAAQRSPAPGDFWTVQTTTGAVKGHAETGTAAFRGIPYAQPPIGSRRFRRAEPIEPWEGTFEARADGEYCYQFRNKATGWIGSEDCLWLSVVVPRGTARGNNTTNADSATDVDTATDAEPATGADTAPARINKEHAIDATARRPIAVHLHGGSNVHGSAADPQRSGEHFAQATDSIYVGVNYRLGMFGQLFFGEGFDDERIDTNAGLSDIIEALKWIQANARAFGGDPERITIFGESSGGAMVTALMTSPALEGVIAGAIAQSPAGAMVHTPENAKYWREQAMVELARIRGLVDKEKAKAEAKSKDTDKHKDAGTGAEPAPATGGLSVDDLFDATATELGEITEALVAHNLRYAPGVSGPFAPIVDGDLLPKHPLAKGAQRDLPLLVGYNRDEYRLMRWEPLRTKHQWSRTVALAGHVSTDVDELLQHYKGVQRRSAVGEFTGHAIFVAPAYLLAEQHPTGKVWFYRLDMTTPSLELSGMGATHALDLPLLFRRVDTSRGKLALALGGAKQMNRTSEAMLRRWRAFLHDLDPGFERYRGDADAEGATAPGTAGAATQSSTVSNSAEGADPARHIQVFDGKRFESGEENQILEPSPRWKAWEKLHIPQV
ncbi:carboxylesterase family protein [Corynebacterium urealyticum]|uniref:carboxylesterase family protein n=1 Tax=Corynebacterium urealyticum TaxID=43771 RepID=UPI0011E7FE37|nr:carboxylesterase family protein [Corynebacterium urealyticum]TYR17636.1 carboxylesterase family protein [Corynebacterium urealyticum]TYT20510.1 carboxylesterase family protein [Corynebacterium urealyticum]